MPIQKSEIASGAQFTRSSEEGSVSDSQSRTFRLVLGTPGEYVDFQDECGIAIGDPHPANTDIFCQSFEARFDGDSRMVLLVTFNYGTKASSAGSGGDAAGSASAPDIRPANWTTGVATYESPVRSWQMVYKSGVAGGSGPAVNPVGDMYDGIVRLEPIVTISVTQPQSVDPLANIDAVGCINKLPIKIGKKTLPTCTVMLRSIQSQPTVEAWGKRIFRGWSATYEFLYKLNPTEISAVDFDSSVSTETQDIGWDVAVPVSGFNVKAFEPNVNPVGEWANVDPYGQPLKHKNGTIVFPLEKMDGVAVGDKVRAMIRIFDYENGGATQAPSAQPIPLTLDGYPRKEDADPKVLVRRYRIYKEYDFNKLGLRLF